MEFKINIPDQAVNEDPCLITWIDCVRRMADRMSMSHFKYGNMEDKYPHSAKSITNVEERMRMYNESGNCEDMLDAANFCIIEAICPSHPKRHFRARKSEETNLVYGGTED